MRVIKARVRVSTVNKDKEGVKVRAIEYQGKGNGNQSETRHPSKPKKLLGRESNPHHLRIFVSE